MKKQVKPVIPDNLQPVENGIEWMLHCKANEERVRGNAFYDMNTKEEDFSQIIISGAGFTNCRFWNCHFKQSGFTDVIFRACDFSGCIFDDSNFDRVEFLSCKAVGARFTANRMINVAMKDCNMDYVNMDNSILKQLLLENVQLNSSNLSHCRCRDILWNHVQLTNASFFKTPLRGMDFTESDINGLILSDDNEELKGAVVDIYQAAELAKRMGLTIK